MPSDFPESTIHWLKIGPELAEAEERFRCEFHRMLALVETRFLRAGWKTNLSDTRVQVYRPTWQDGWEGIHYEAFSSGDYFRIGTIHLGLHVEKGTPNESAVREGLRQLLKRTEDRLLSAAGCKVVPQCHWRVLEGALDLIETSDEAIGDALEQMIQTESFVEEALFLADKKTVWRTDFLPDDPLPEIDWSVWSGKEGGRGGWQLRADGGRLGTPSLIFQGQKRNYKGKENIAALHDSEREPFRAFTPGQHVYCCSLVRCPAGGSVTFTLQTTKEGQYQSGYTETRRLAAADRWQMVCFEGELARLTDYDPALQGLYAYLLIDPSLQPITIDSIEIGTACCRPS